MNLLGTPAIGLLYICFLLALAKFISGTYRAWLNGVFELTALKAWISEEGNHLVPIVLWMGLGLALGLVDLSAISAKYGIDVGALGGTALMGYGAVQAGTYIISTLSSVKDNLQPRNPTQFAAKIKKAAAVGDPIPGTTAIAR